MKILIICSLVLISTLIFYGLGRIIVDKLLEDLLAETNMGLAETRWIFLSIALFLSLFFSLFVYYKFIAPEEWNQGKQEPDRPPTPSILSSMPIKNY